MSIISVPPLAVSRRTVLVGMGAVATLAAPAIVRAQPSQVVIRTGGGKLDDALRASVFDPFTEKTGIEVVSAAGPAAQLKAMVEGEHVEWDLMQGSAELMVVYGREGLFEPLDLSMLPTGSMAQGTVHELFVLTDFAAYIMAWSTTNLPHGGPRTWADFFALEGRLGMWQMPYQTLEAALLGDGVPIDQLYPLDLDRAFASLDRVKDRLILWDSGAKGVQILIDGEADAGATWNGRVSEPKQEGAPVDYHFNQAILVSDAWAIPKGAPNRDAAMELLAFSLTAEAQANFSKAIPYAPVNNDALALIDDATKATLPIHDSSNVLLNVDYWADNLSNATERFNSWLLT